MVATLAALPLPLLCDLRHGAGRGDKVLLDGKADRKVEREREIYPPTYPSIYLPTHPSVYLSRWYCAASRATWG